MHVDTLELIGRPPPVVIGEFLAIDQPISKILLVLGQHILRALNQVETQPILVGEKVQF